MHPFFPNTPSRIERLGILLACFIIALCLGIRSWIDIKKNNEITENTNWPLWDSLLTEAIQYSNKNDSINLQPFPFNPNTVSEEALKKMRLRNKLIQTWLNYRAKGGRFYSVEQVKRLYAMRDTEYVQLAPYIQIENNPIRNAPQPIIELNSTDTTQLKTLTGIGQKRAIAIIAFRNQLGGFYSTKQLMEVWGIDTSIYNKIKPRLRVNGKAIKPLPLLDVTWNELKQHPYFSGDLGRQILSWRKAKNYHIESLDELTEIKAVDSVLFRKIVPYLSLENIQ